MIATIVPAVLATIVALIALWPTNVPEAPAESGAPKRAYGQVLKVVEQTCEAAPEPGLPGAFTKGPCGTVTVRVEEGPGAGQTVETELPRGAGAPRVDVDDNVVLLQLGDAIEGATGYTIVDHQRGRPMIWLLALAAAVIIAFGRWRGLSALAGLAVSFAVLLLFVIPAILSGASPLLVAIVGAATIMFAVLYLTHGLNVHTSVAILGTLASLVLTGVLAAVFTAFTELTGIAGEDSAFLAVSQGNVDMRGLLLAGIIIGSLGVLDDVTVTQASTVAELARTPMPRIQLYRAATRIGRAHVASAVNTIVLAYAGASLPLLLLIAAGNQKVVELLTSEYLAQEIVRSAVGTIGLVASVPITTALATLVATSARSRDPYPPTFSDR
ncbi:YibE/F family protein [Micromonospora sp. NPDC049679]|uniref:YibE/F family protein n=1 Tax=Micromonospora sp. NPDC049679 TaxID=3155920 RepID=UPI00340E90A8